MINVSGRQQAEISTEEAINNVWSGRNGVCLGTSHDGGAPTDGHCRSHNTAAGCCVTSEEAAAAVGAAVVSVLGVGMAADGLNSVSAMGLSSGEMEAGSTVPSCSGMRIKSSIMPE